MRIGITERISIAEAGVRRCFHRRHAGRYGFMRHADAVRHCIRWIAALRLALDEALDGEMQTGVALDLGGRKEAGTSSVGPQPLGKIKEPTGHERSRNN